MLALFVLKHQQLAYIHHQNHLPMQKFFLTSIYNFANA